MSFEQGARQIETTAFLWFLSKAFVRVLAVSITFAGPAHAVNTCEALTFYGNAVKSGLCRNISPATQNLWVCEITDGNPEIHTTFNATTPFHITVAGGGSPNNPICHQGRTLQGSWPGAVSIVGNPQPPVYVCNIDIAPYVTRINAEPQMPAGPATLCRAPFIAAQTKGRITPTVAQQYLNLCVNSNCP